jgi:hypothetical protein
MYIRGIGKATPAARFARAECPIAFQESDWYVRLDQRADGIARSVLQHHISIEARRHTSERSQQPCKSSDQPASKANFVGALLSKGLLQVLSFKGGYGGMVIADKGILTPAFSARPDRLAQMRRASPGVTVCEVVEIMLRHARAGVNAAVLPAIRVGHWLASSPLRTGVRNDCDANVHAPQITMDYRKMRPGAPLWNVIVVVRKDDPFHRDVNHQFADDLKVKVA